MDPYRVYKSRPTKLSCADQRLSADSRTRDQPMFQNDKIKHILCYELYNDVNKRSLI